MALIGMGGHVTVGSVSYCVETWSFKGSNEVQDVTDTCSSGWVTRIPGVSSGEFTFSMFYNQSSPQIGAIVEGTTVTVSGLVATIGDTISGSFVISEVGVDNPAKTAVKVNVTAQSTGAITIVAAP